MSGSIICVGHAALDRVYRVATLPRAAGKIRAIEHIESGGGMAANAAAAIAKLGGKVELWSRVGDDDSGRLIRNGLKSAGVDVRYVQTFEDGRSSNAVVIVDDAGNDSWSARATSTCPMGRAGCRSSGSPVRHSYWLT